MLLVEPERASRHKPALLVWLASAILGAPKDELCRGPLGSATARLGPKPQLAIHLGREAGKLQPLRSAMTSQPSAPISRFTVPAELQGERLDRGLALLVPELSRGRLREMIEDGRVRVADEIVRKPSRTLATGERLCVQVVLRDRARPGSVSTLELGIVHEDDALVVIHKPAGMVVHPSDTVRGGTVAERLVERYGELPELEGDNRPGIVHRLDADTSGLMVVARTSAAGEELKRQFRERLVEKVYVAVVYGEPRFESDWIEGAIGRSARHSDRMAIVSDEEGRSAETFYSVTERFAFSALLECRPKTGRTHQIRVHLASIGHAILGDKLYRTHARQTPKLPAGVAVPSRQALHAQGLAFQHPVSGARVSFEAPLPPDMAELIDALRRASVEA